MIKKPPAFQIIFINIAPAISILHETCGQVNLFIYLLEKIMIKPTDRKCAYSDGLGSTQCGRGNIPNSGRDTRIGCVLL